MGHYDAIRAGQHVISDGEQSLGRSRAYIRVFSFLCLTLHHGRNYLLLYNFIIFLMSFISILLAKCEYQKRRRYANELPTKHVSFDFFFPFVLISFIVLLLVIGLFRVLSLMVLDAVVNMTEDASYAVFVRDI